MQHTCDTLSVCCCPGATAVYVGCYVMYLFAVFFCDRGVRCGPCICSQDDAILYLSEELLDSGVFSFQTCLNDWAMDT